MEENQIQTESQNATIQTAEPVVSDNSTVLDESSSKAENEFNVVGESNSQDPATELILGKFKSVEDLSNAYEELERYQGRCSDELGSLRKELASMRDVQDAFSAYNTMQSVYLEVAQRDKEKYNTPEYFQDPTFREIYKEALLSLGGNLDTDKLVNLLDSYVSARIYAHDRKKAAQIETQKVLDSMTYDKNSKSSFTPPQKRFDEMTEQEIDEMLERLI